MFDNNNNFKYFLRQDTILIKPVIKDSSATKPFKDPFVDTANAIPSGLSDTISNKRIEITKQEIKLKSDSSKTRPEKRIIITKDLNLDESKQTIEVKREGKLSWNAPEDLAKEFFLPYAGSENLYHSVTTDTVTTHSEIQQKGPVFFKRIQSNTDWIFWTYIIIVLLFVWIQVFYRKYIVSLFNSGISYHMSTKLMNEKNILTRRVSVVLNFIFTVSVTLVIFKFIQYLGIRSDKFNRFSLFLLILNLVILYSVAKVILQKIIGIIFLRLEQIDEYLHNIYVYNKILGIILLPLSFASFYTPNRITEVLLLSAILLFVFSILFKIIRGFQIIIKNGIFILYTILYLCTLEILPVLIGYKIFKTLA